MEIDQLEHWLEEHHYPQLVLQDGDIVKSGPFAWKRLLSDTSGRIDVALARINAFLERIEREKRGKRCTANTAEGSSCHQKHNGRMSATIW